MCIFPSKTNLLPFLVMSLLLFSLSACGAPSPAPIPVQAVSATAPPTAAAIPSVPPPTPIPSRTPTLSPLKRTTYQLSVKVDYAQHAAVIVEKIDFTNPASDPLSTLSFLVEPNRYPGSFQLQDITIADQPVADYTLTKNRLDLALPQPLASRASLNIGLNFQLALPQIPPPSDTTRPVPYGYSDRQLNLVDWYPCLPPYQPGQGWLIHAPGFYGEHQVYDVADYQIDLELVNAPQGTLVAASAASAASGASGASAADTTDQSSSNGPQSRHYRLDAARNFALSASPEYKLSQQTVGSVTVLDYYFPFNPAAGERVLKDAADAIALYSTLFGPYPHQTFSIVEADFLDGMEYDGLVFLSRGFYNLYDGTSKGYLTAIAVHETAHQWWYALVGNDQALEPWLDEAMATYTERIFYAKTYPDLVSWWWAFRVNFYQPTGWINQPVYDYGGFTPYRNAVYLRGAQFLEELRKRMGDEAFYAFLKDYAAQEGGKLSTRQDFFRILAQHSQADIQSLVKEYFK